MRVLYVSHTSLISGAEGALTDLLAHLPSSITPTLACPAGPLAGRAHALGVPVLAIPEVSGSFRVGLRQTPAAVRQLALTAVALRRIVQAERPDLVHANGLRASVFAWAALAGLRTPLVAHCHDALPPNLQGRVVGAVLARAAAVVAVSEHTARTLAKAVPQSRLSVLYSPLDTTRFDPERITRSAARAKLGFADEVELIGLVGQITPWKGHDTAIRALHAVRDSHPHARLLFVGEPKFTSRSTRFDNRAFDRSLKALTWELGVADRVEFWGERADVDVLIRALDVCVAPSWQEPFGRTLVEAMALETAVVATSIGGPPEYITNGVTGLLAVPNDVAAWAASVRRLLEVPTERAEIARRASTAVRRRFEIDEYVRSVGELYESLVPRTTVKATTSDDRFFARRDGYDGASTNRRLRIIFVEHSSTTSGAQHSLFELMRTLDTDHDVTLACPDGYLAEQMRLQGYSVIKIPDSQLSFRLSAITTPLETARALRARVAVVRLVRRLRPDIVHANSIRAGLLTVFHRTDAPVVVHCRDLLPRGWSGRAVSHFMLGRASAVIAVSHAVAARLRASPRQAGKVVVVDNPVDASRFDPEIVRSDKARSHLRIDGGPVLGLVAQITPWKGHTRAVQVLAGIHAKHPDAKLVIAGAAKFVTSGTRYDNLAYDAELRRLVSELGLDDAVVFLGESRWVPGVIAAVDVLLVPSTEEPFGRTIIEALAMGVPVVATDAGGPPEIIRWGLDGFVLNPDATEAWESAVELLASRGSRSESRRYAVERFSPRRHSRAVLTVYESLLSDRRLS